MNTAYTVAAGLAKKKKQPGSLMGYKVSSRAPPSAVNSGTKQKTMKAFKEPPPLNKNIKEVNPEDVSGSLSGLVTIWAGLTGLWVISNLAPM